MSKVPTAEVANTHYYLQNLNDERKRMALGFLAVGLDNGDITQDDILALLSNRSPPASLGG